jgi:hypothetical protein
MEYHMEISGCPVDIHSCPNDIHETVLGFTTMGKTRITMRHKTEIRINCNIAC